MRKRRFWGWGWDDEGPEPARLAAAKAGIEAMLGRSVPTPLAEPTIDEIALRPPRIAPPPALAELVTDDPFERASHSYGKSFRDVVRCYRRQFDNPVDLVALPADESDVVRLLDWCAGARIAAIPYGGGSSVCAGVEPLVGDRFAGTLSIDLQRLDRVRDIDRDARAARVEGGVYGPALESQLAPAGLTLRHYPQSFEHSTLGGWIATRSGGHYATLYTHIDEFVEALRVVTPTGIAATRRLPASGAGPSPERLFIGSEGALGIITEAWMRLQHRPVHRAQATATFADFAAGARAVRLLAQSGLHPANCRLLDPLEAFLNGAGDGSRAPLFVAFESADHPLGAWIERAVELCRDAGGTVDAPRIRQADVGPREHAADAWRAAFVRAPYLRDALVGLGMIAETFETAVTWDRFDAFVAAVRDATTSAVNDACGAGIVTCRITHAYPDGAAPYFTVVAPARSGDELTQWDAIKTAASEAILGHGGTITHHHAVGRDFDRWYRREIPEPFGRMLAAAKRAVDPGGICNPGVLVPLHDAS